MTYILTDLTDPVRQGAEAIFSDENPFEGLSRTNQRIVLSAALILIAAAAPVIAADTLGVVEGALLQGLPHSLACISLYDDDTICDCHGDVLKVLTEVRASISSQ